MQVIPLRHIAHVTPNQLAFVHPLLPQVDVFAYFDRGSDQDPGIECRTKKWYPITFNCLREFLRIPSPPSSPFLEPLAFLTDLAEPICRFALAGCDLLLQFGRHLVICLPKPQGHVVLCYQKLPLYSRLTWV